MDGTDDFQAFLLMICPKNPDPSYENTRPS